MLTDIASSTESNVFICQDKYVSSGSGEHADVPMQGYLCYLGRASAVKHRPVLSWCAQGPCLSLVFLVIYLVRCQLSPVSANQLFLTAPANLSDNGG